MMGGLFGALLREPSANEKTKIAIEGIEVQTKATLPNTFKLAIEKQKKMMQLKIKESIISKIK